MRGDGALEVPGESVTDPVAYTLALAAAAERHGAELRTGFRVAGIAPRRRRIVVSAPRTAARLPCAVVVNCAGLGADEVARLAGDDSFDVYPAQGRVPGLRSAPGAPLERILLPVPTKRTKGVLVFPTLDGKVVAGPTAIDQEDPDDWSVRPQAARGDPAEGGAMFPPLAAAEPIFAYAGLRPAGRGVNYVIAASARLPGPDQRRGDTLDRLDRLAGHRRARERAGRRARVELATPAPPAALARRRPRRLAPPWWRRTAEHRGRMSLLLGIDEGTSAVKAILFDAELRPLAEARREKPLTHPRPGWVEQDPEVIVTAVVEAVAEVLGAADGEVVACGLDHQGESVLAWDAESGEPLTPVVTWQDKRSQEVLDRLDGRGPRGRGPASAAGCRSIPTSRPASSPGCSKTTIAFPRRREAGTLRLGTVDSFLCDPPRSGVRDRSLDRFADPARRA